MIVRTYAVGQHQGGAPRVDHGSHWPTGPKAELSAHCTTLYIEEFKSVYFKNIQFIVHYQCWYLAVTKIFYCSPVAHWWKKCGATTAKKLLRRLELKNGHSDWIFSKVFASHRIGEVPVIVALPVSFLIPPFLKLCWTHKFVRLWWCFTRKQIYVP